MKKLLFILIFLISGAAFTTSVHAELCYLCASGSGCEQCRAGSDNDTQDARKACEQKGCKVNGYTSCSSAVNIKKCMLNEDKQSWPKIAAAVK
jgi:hypothetical protein